MRIKQCIGLCLAAALCSCAGVAYAVDVSAPDTERESVSLSYDTAVDEAAWCVPIDESIFPDRAFREVIASYDANQDGCISAKEASCIVLEDAPVESLQGIETLKDLVRVTISGNTTLKVADFSGCSALSELFIENNSIECITFPEEPLDTVLFFDQHLAGVSVGKTMTGWAYKPDATTADIASASDVAAASLAAKTLYAVVAPAQGPLWQEIDNVWFYTVDGKVLASGRQVIDGEVYNVGDLGQMVAGWNQQNGDWYYFDPAHKGAMAYGWITVDGYRYYLNDQGVLQSGWLQLGPDEYYLLNEEHDGTFGAQLMGWEYVDAWYYLDPTLKGALYYGWLNAPDGKTYFCNDTHDGWFGAMTTGWYADPANWDRYYYFSSSGAQVINDWVYKGGYWYFITSEGLLAYGLVDVDGITYSFETEHDGYFGSMKTGWVSADQETWYYFNDSGYLAHGWFYVGGEWYYANDDGSLYSGWLHAPEGWYALNPHHDGHFGAMIVGSEKIDGSAEYFDTRGLWHESGWVKNDMTKRAQWYSSSTRWMLMVDTSRCWVGVFYNYNGTWELEKIFRCSTGAPGSPTLTGQYTVGAKGYAFGHGYTCYYYTQFYGDYLFHSVTYYPGTFSIMEGAMGAHISAGCVRLEIHNAKWIYDNIPYRTRVVNY